MGFDAKELGTIIATGRATGASPEQLQDLNAEYKVKQMGGNFQEILEATANGDRATAEQLSMQYGIPLTPQMNANLRKGAITTLDGMLKGDDSYTEINAYLDSTPEGAELRKSEGVRKELNDKRFKEAQDKYTGFLASPQGSQMMSGLRSLINPATGNFKDLAAARANFDKAIANSEMGLDNKADIERLWELAKAQASLNQDAAAKALVRGSTAKGKEPSATDFVDKANEYIDRLNKEIDGLYAETRKKGKGIEALTEGQRMEIDNRINAAKAEREMWGGVKANSNKYYQKYKDIGAFQEAVSSEADKYRVDVAGAELGEAGFGKKAKKAIEQLQTYKWVGEVEQFEHEGKPYLVVYGTNPDGSVNRNKIMDFVGNLDEEAPRFGALDEGLRQELVGALSEYRKGPMRREAEQAEISRLMERQGGRSSGVLTREDIERQEGVERGILGVSSEALLRKRQEELEHRAKGEAAALAGSERASRR
jgi:hypothetical protein